MIVSYTRTTESRINQVPVVDGQIVVSTMPSAAKIYVDAGAIRLPVAGSSGASSLADLTDTSLLSPVSGQVLTYDGSTGKWKNVDNVGKERLSELRDVNISGELVDGVPLQYDAASQKWVASNTPMPISYGGTGNDKGYIQAGADPATQVAANATAEGYNTKATDQAAHAEGYGSQASGKYSHSEGYNTQAAADSAHAEGNSTVASGRNSHSSGLGTTAAYDNQFVLGKYNQNKHNTLLEVGYGTDASTPANVFEITTEGDVDYKGTLKQNGVDVLSTKYDSADPPEATIETADSVPFYDKSATANKKITFTNFVSKIEDEVGLGDLRTVEISSPEDGEALVYNADKQIWTNGPGGAGADNVVEGYRKNADGLFYKESTYETLIPGEPDTIYISVDTNETYRYDGEDFVKVAVDAVTISQAEFEELTPAEKDNGTAYYIPDMNPSSNFLVMGNRFDKANIYRDVETMVGSYLGKPLYQQTFSGTTAATTESAAKIKVDAKIDAVVHTSGKLKSSESTWVDLGTSDAQNWSSVIVTDDTAEENNTILIRTSGNYVNKPFNLTIQYTKVGDVTANIAAGDDYSEDEHIVGTWIDGKRVYQKTIMLKTRIESFSGKWVNNVAFVANNIESVAQVIPYCGMTQTGLELVRVHNNGYYDVFHPSGTNIPHNGITIQYTKTTD